jgi:U3 small nucleolar ribonucleoprotein protein IMP3
MRKLKFHEKKLLKKVDFMSWEIDNNLHEVRIMKKYYVQKREDYHKWLPVTRVVVEMLMETIKLHSLHQPVK